MNELSVRWTSEARSSRRSSHPARHAPTGSAGRPGDPGDPSPVPRWPGCHRGARHSCRPPGARCRPAPHPPPVPSACSCADGSGRHPGRRQAGPGIDAVGARWSGQDTMHRATVPSSAPWGLPQPSSVSWVPVPSPSPWSPGCPGRPPSRSRQGSITRRAAVGAGPPRPPPASGYQPYVGLPAGWTLTGSRLSYDTSGLPAWSLDYVTDHGTSVGLEQVRGWTAQWQSSLTHGGRRRGHVEVAGRRFETYLMAPRAITSWLLREGRAHHAGPGEGRRWCRCPTPCRESAGRAVTPTRAAGS